jgi:hypothetical protein
MPIRLFHVLWVVEASGIAALRTADRAPRQNTARGRFLGSVRRACLGHR